MARELAAPDQDKSRPSHEEIARRAYEIFKERGQPPGQDLEHWFEAETQLCATLGSRERKSEAPAAKAPRSGNRQSTLRRS